MNLLVADKLNKAIKIIFPDLTIAKNVRSKGTAVTKEIAAKTTFSLAEIMKKLGVYHFN